LSGEPGDGRSSKLAIFTISTAFPSIVPASIKNKVPTGVTPSPIFTRGDRCVLSGL
jgi:hypothetical protein